MSASDTLTRELRAEVLRLEDDLRARVASLPEVQSAWRKEYDAARTAERTAAAWEAWVDERVTLAAVAWVLTTVFIRFCEDNGLVKPVWISGPRSREAIEAQQQFLRETARANADVTDREWLLQAIGHLASLPATAALVDDNSPMWLVTPSGDAATQLLNFWRERDESGALVRDLGDPDLDTRFLGDLYQDISEDAKKRYALLQTPVFVEEFILDRTLEPALDERPLEGFRMIDPTCGSGHFLLGGFQRLLDHWHKQAPGLDERERVQAALDCVYGVDLNPFAVAISRFRLTAAALQACGLKKLEEAPAFNYHLAAGDSLLHGLDQQEIDLGAAFSADRVAANFAYETENLEALRSILRNGQYDAVVGNPPYITVKDKTLNDLYRREYRYCKGKYALTVPFMERFYRLAKHGNNAGWIGQITSNSFMKREFGAPLIEKFLPTVDLRLVADTSGAYIPGHGTPTVVVVGRNARPVSSTVRAILGVRSEPGRPADPAMGKVWSSLTTHIDDPGYSDEWITVADLPRDLLANHPWSLSGGGAVELLAEIEESVTRRLGDDTYRLGVFGVMGSDDAMTVKEGVVRRSSLERGVTQRLVLGDQVRDFRVHEGDPTWFPYNSNHELQSIDGYPRWHRQLWRVRTELGNRATFTKGTYFSDGRPWWEWHQLPKDAGASRLTLAYAFVTTHNHFVLDRGGKVFNRSAPVVKLPDGTSEEQHLELLGVLNSSTACFWLKQNSHNKGRPGAEAGGADEPWEHRFEFTGTTLQDFPLPKSLSSKRGALLDRLALESSARSPHAVIASSTPSRAALDTARNEYESLRGQMVAQQEELDWEIYRSFGLVDEDFTYLGDDLPRLAPAERAFAIVLARQMADGLDTSWFSHWNHKYQPVVEIQGHWPPAYRDLVQRRIDLIENHPYIRLLEKPEHKRRWASDPWEKQEAQALSGWLLDHLEDRKYWFDQYGRPSSKSLGLLSDEVERDGELKEVLALWEGRLDVTVATSLGKLLAPEAVPFLASYRLKEVGLRKHVAWESTWEAQRQQDAGNYSSAPKERGGDGPIPAPPKYTTADFIKTDYWSHRGKLDVPKERFILYPSAGRGSDASNVFGWAGWDHAQQALALATLIQAGEQQGWSEDRLIPLVAGLSELLPWVEQWHTDSDPLYGGSSPAEFFSGLLDNYMVKLGATRESLAAWRPPAPTRGRKAKS